MRRNAFATACSRSGRPPAGRLSVRRSQTCRRFFKRAGFRRFAALLGDGPGLPRRRSRFSRAFGAGRKRSGRPDSGPQPGRSAVRGRASPPERDVGRELQPFAQGLGLAVPGLVAVLRQVDEPDVGEGAGRRGRSVRTGVARAPRPCRGVPACPGAGPERRRHEGERLSLPPGPDAQPVPGIGIPAWRTFRPAMPGNMKKPGPAGTLPDGPQPSRPRPDGPEPRPSPATPRSRAAARPEAVRTAASRPLPGAGNGRRSAESQAVGNCCACSTSR